MGSGGYDLINGAHFVKNQMMEIGVRVNLVGNVCNNHFTNAIALRRNGVDAHLYYQKPSHPQYLPESEDSGICSEMPDWLHPFPPQRRKWQPHDIISASLLSDIAHCDILHVHGEALIWAAKANRPTVWQPYGTDLFEFPFWNRWFFPYLGRVPVFRATEIFTPLLMRRAIASADRTLLSWEDELWKEGVRLTFKLVTEKRVCRLPLAINTEKYNMPSAEEKRVLRRSLIPDIRDTDLLVFHPTRQHEEYKGNSKLYRALAMIANKGVRFKAVLVNKGESDADGFKASKNIIKRLGIENSVIWIDFLPREMLTSWYGASDVIADQFICGGLGSVSMEALSCGRPLLVYLRTHPSERPPFLDPKHMFEELPPILNANSSEMIADHLYALATTPKLIEMIGKSARLWAESNIGLDPVANRLIDIYQSVLDERNCSRGRQNGPPHRHE